MKIFEFFVAKNANGILQFFKDQPDLVRFNSDSDIEWTGYPLDFGDFVYIKKIVEKKVADIEPLSEIVVCKLSRFDISFSTIKLSGYTD